MTENLLRQLELLPANLASHLMITVVPLVIGVSISLPLAVMVVKQPRMRYPTLTLVSIVQTIPSLALLALMVPVLVAVGTVTSWALGVEISALGFYPTVIALTLYSMLPIVRNTVTGITGVEPSMVEAARGVGMTERQVLWKVELPLAMPVIIAGIRTATVWVVGIATLATPVGQRCLGNFIFQGLQTRNWTAVLVGCIAAALLAIVLDLLIGGVEKAVKDRNRRLGTLAAAALGTVLVGGLFAPMVVRWADPRPTVWVGSKSFTEQYILAALMSQLLDDAGYNAQSRDGLGSTVIFDALAQEEIDAYVDYTGTIWANYMNRREVADSETVLEEVTEWLRQEHGIHCLGTLGFENAYALAMRREQAEELGIQTIADLVPHAAGMKIGGDYEFFGRPEWRDIRDTYRLRFADQTSYDSTFMYTAVAQGDVDVISAFSSDGRIVAFDLVVLEDPEGVIPPYDAVLLLSDRAAQDPEVEAAFRPLIEAIPVEMMRRANFRVDRDEDKQTPNRAARWLHEQVLQSHADYAVVDE